MYGLGLQAKLACRRRGQSISLVPNHDPPNIATFRFNHVTAIDRHWIAVAVIVKRCRRWTHLPGTWIEVEMPWRNAAQKRRVIAIAGSSGKSLPQSSGLKP
jgi:hypothetical protein